MKKTTAKRWLSIVLTVCMLFGGMAAAFPLKSEAASATRRMANVVVFVNFKDTVSTKLHDSHLNGYCYGREGAAQLTRDLFDGSDEKPRAMKQYLKNISYGQLEVENVFPQISGDELVPYTLEFDLNHYLNAAGNADTNTDTYIIREVLSRLEKDKALTQNLSLDGDNVIDNLMIVVPCETGEKNDKFIGHESHYAGNETVHQYNGANPVKEYRVGSYVILPEATTYTFAHSGVIIHEFLHAVGYPDLYRSDRDMSESPVGVWDIMGSTGAYPSYPLAYLRSGLTKWFSIPTVTTSQKGYSLYAASAATEAVKDRQAVILRTDYSNTEFFVLEYRKQGKDRKTEYDCMLPDSGLIIYRVDTKSGTNHGGGRDMIYIMRPGDEYDSNGRERGLNVSKAGLSETSYGSSDPDKSLKDNAIVYSDGTNSGIVISNIGKAGGDQITFDIQFSENQKDVAWTTAASQDNTLEIASYMDSDGVLYSLQRKGSDVSAPVYLYRYDASGWKQYSTVPIQNISFDFKLGKYGGNFYAGYFDRSSYKLKLDQWMGSYWKNVYTSSAQSYYFSMTSASDGIYLSCPDTSGNNLYAYRYTSAGVESLGTRVCQGSGISNSSIAAENGTVAVMYRDAQQDLRVMTYNSSNRTWKEAGAFSVKGGYGLIRLHKNRIYLLRSGRYGESFGDLYMYDLSDANGSWKQVGNGSFANENMSEADICFFGDDPHVVYAGSTSKAVWAKNVVNGSWAMLGSKITNETVSGLQACSYGGKIYTTYCNGQLYLAYIRTHSVNSSGKAPEGGTTVGGSRTTTGGTTSGNSGSTTGGNSGSTTGGNTGSTTGGNSGSTTGGTTSGNSGTTSGGNSGNPSGGITGGNVVQPVTLPELVDKSGIQNIRISQLKSTTLQLTWTPVSGAISYEVYYSTSKDSGYKRVATAKTATYKFTRAKCGETYYFKIRTISKSGKTKVYGEYSLPVSGRTVLNGAPYVYVSKATYNSLTIKWSKVQDANKYEIYYSTSPNGTYQLLKTQGGTSFTHKGLQTGAVYYYQVRPVRDYYKGTFSNQTSARTILGSVTNLKATASGVDKMKVSWKKVPGVNYYVVLRSDSAYGAYKQIAVTDKTSFVDTGLAEGTAYYYKVYAVAGPYKTNEAGPVGQVTKTKKKK